MCLRIFIMVSNVVYVCMFFVIVLWMGVFMKIKMD